MFGTTPQIKFYLNQCTFKYNQFRDYWEIFLIFKPHVFEYKENLHFAPFRR